MNGGIKIDGSGVNPVNALPAKVEDILFEEPPGSAVLVDNRLGVASQDSMTLENVAAQDNLTGNYIYYFNYTDNEPPSGGSFAARNLSTTDAHSFEGGT